MTAKSRMRSSVSMREVTGPAGRFNSRHGASALAAPRSAYSSPSAACGAASRRSSARRSGRGHGRSPRRTTAVAGAQLRAVLAVHGEDDLVHAGQRRHGDLGMSIGSTSGRTTSVCGQIGVAMMQSSGHDDGTAGRQRVGGGAGRRGEDDAVGRVGADLLVVGADVHGRRMTRAKPPLCSTASLSAMKVPGAGAP
jgi:hypothetical protein